MSEPAKEGLTWTACPVRDEWPGSLLKVALLAAIVALLFLSFGNLGWIGLALLLLALARYFLPTRYEFTAEGITVTFAGAAKLRKWSACRRYYPHAMGVHISPFEKPSALDPFRGVFLRFHSNREEVIAFLEKAGLRKGEKGGATPPGSSVPPPAGPAPSGG